jgi:prevent-host-death family protein
LTPDVLNLTVVLKEFLAQDLKEMLVNAQVITGPSESPGGDLYDPDVAKTQQRGIEEARKELGPILTAAEKEKVHTVVSRHGASKGVIVPMEWYRRMRELDGDPTDL